MKNSGDNRRCGFTLIELSIVLVIIGLVVGGVLVGYEMVNTSQIRKEVTQIEKYNQAVNTFRAKFNALPGDMNATAAAQFGFSTRGPYRGMGDGNGAIEENQCDCPSGGVGYYQNGGETGLFWVDLSAANLIDDNLNTAFFGSVDPSASSNVTPISAYLPLAKIGGGNYV